MNQEAFENLILMDAGLGPWYLRKDATFTAEQVKRLLYRLKEPYESLFANVDELLAVCEEPKVRSACTAFLPSFDQLIDEIREQLTAAENDDVDMMTE